MLPEACLQQVEEYKDRLVNFKARRRKSSICLSPTMVLKARGIRMFPEDSSSSGPCTSSATRSVFGFLECGLGIYEGSHGHQARLVTYLCRNLVFS